MNCGAVIPAAGQGRRFGDGDKTVLTIAGRSVIEWTLDALIHSGKLAQIAIVVSEMNQFPVIELISRLRVPIPVSTVQGGALRMDSVRAGVSALHSDCELVLIHDAARPVVSVELIREAIQAGREHGAAIPGTAVTDTIKRVDEGRVSETLDRESLFAVQTPQVFRRDWLEAGYASLGPGIEATDEASILELAGYPVHMFPGDPANIKVTTAVDAVVAEALLTLSGSQE